MIRREGGFEKCADLDVFDICLEIGDGVLEESWDLVLLSHIADADDELMSSY